MEINEYLKLISKVEIGNDSAISVVVLKKNNENVKAPNYIVCTGDNLPCGPTTIVMQTLAYTVLHILATRSGSLDDNINRFLNTLQETSVTYTKNMGDKIINECRQILSQNQK